MRFTVETDAPAVVATSRGTREMLGGRYLLTLEVVGLTSEQESALGKTDQATARIIDRMQSELARFRDILEAAARTAREEAQNVVRIREERAARKAAGLPEPDAVVVPAGTKDPALSVRIPAGAVRT